MTKYIFVTGGVLSSLGKGISSASIGTLLKHSGYKVSILKIDPYINIDPGTMSPLEHGEVFVTADGGETDLDIGNYERFLDENISKKNNFTTGQVYQSVINRERKGDYLGKTIQVIPHITDEIKNRIKKAGKGNDILIIELGGTIGDIEGLPFLEAVREMVLELGESKVLNIQVSLVPYISAAGELKTKPTQHSIQELRRIGINPDIIIARCEVPLPKSIKEKLARSCGLNTSNVIEAMNESSIYKIPLNFLRDDILTPIFEKLNLQKHTPDMSEWNILVKKILAPTNSVTIGFVGKYLDSKESYKSLTEALIHAGAALDTKVNIKWIDSENLSALNAEEAFADIDAILVAGGFGIRGVEGKIRSIQYARENNVPFLGICLGMQLSIIEYARNVLGISDANSVEFDHESPNPFIYLIDEFIDQEGDKQVRTSKSPMGGSLRLGSYPCDIKEHSRLYDAYAKLHIDERHRHRYEANPKYRTQLEEAGMLISGEGSGLIEAVEIPKHPWFVGVQFHPEFTSRLKKPNALIKAFVENALKHND